MPDDDDSGNEADSESEADMPTILVNEPAIACFNNLKCNTPSEDEGEWVINDNISFDYVSVGLFESVTDSSLHMPLHKPSASSTPVKFIEGSVLVVPPSKEGQLPIIFPTAKVFSRGFKFRLRHPTNFQLYAISTPYDEENGIQPEAPEEPTSAASPPDSSETAK